MNSEILATIECPECYADAHKLDAGRFTCTECSWDVEECECGDALADDHYCYAIAGESHFAQSMADHDR